MNEFISSKDAREILNISRQRLNQLAQAGLINIKVINKRIIYYSQPDIIKYKETPKNKGGRPRKKVNND